MKKITDRANTMEGMIESALELLEKPDFLVNLPRKQFEHAFGIVR